MRKFIQRILRCALLFLCIFVITCCKITFNDGESLTEEDPIPQATPFFISNTPIDGTLIRVLDGMTMISIPTGEFTMGKEGEKMEQQHLVYLGTYWIDQTEVTTGMYAKCVADGVCQEPSQSDSRSRESYYDNSAYAEYPVIYVSWYQAQTYCNWVGARLPTEAEWEKAARGTDGRLYPWGNASPSDDFLNYSNNEDTLPAGKYPGGASPYGVLDLSANVREWTADWFDGEYYAVSPYENPQGPSEGDLRTVRGSSWNEPTIYRGVSDIASRAMALPQYTANDIGFRCAFSH